MNTSIFFCGFLLLLAGVSFAVPTVVIISPANTTYYNRSVLLNVTIAGNVSIPVCAYSLNNWANNTTFNCPTTFMNASNGTSTVLVRANDTTGINDTGSVSFTVSPSVMNYVIPAPNASVSNPYVYDAGANLTSLGYSIPATAVWVQAPYVYDAGANVSVSVYPVPSAGLWVRDAYFYNATTGIIIAVYPIPLTGVNVIISNITYCASGNDCASVGNLCINGTCRGLTASGSDLGAKCSVGSTNYNLTGYTWSAGGCTIPSQSKSVQGIGTFNFDNVKVGIRAFRAYFESDPANSTYAYYLISKTNASDNFANVQLVVFVNSSSARTVRGELGG